MITEILTEPPLFDFSDVVLVDTDQVGCIVKTWRGQYGEYNYDVYVRSYNAIKNYKENQIRRYPFGKY